LKDYRSLTKPETYLIAMRRLPVVNKAGDILDRHATTAGFSILLALVSVALVPAIGRAKPGITAAVRVLRSIFLY